MEYHLLLLFLTIIIGSNCCGDFYWRDYDGSIPDDAIPAGRHENGLAYIGQAYIHNYGLLLGKIVPGSMKMDIACYGVRKISDIMKILCAKDQSKYVWLPATCAVYAKDTVDRCSVLGGYDQRASENTNVTLGTLHIGRTLKHGDVIIGNIAIYNLAHPWFYYPLNDKEVTDSNYEVLFFTNNSSSELQKLA